MLPTLNITLPSINTASAESNETPLIQDDSADCASEELGFDTLLAQFGSDPAAKLEMKELAALVHQFSDLSGEVLPLIPNAVGQNEEVVPESLAGEALLAYLMANSGLAAEEGQQEDLPAVEELISPHSAIDNGEAEVGVTKPILSLYSAEMVESFETVLPEVNLEPDEVDEGTVTEAIATFISGESIDEDMVLGSGDTDPNILHSFETSDSLQAEPDSVEIVEKSADIPTVDPVVLVGTPDDQVAAVTAVDVTKISGVYQVGSGVDEVKPAEWVEAKTKDPSIVVEAKPNANKVDSTLPAEKLVGDEKQMKAPAPESPVNLRQEIKEAQADSQQKGEEQKPVDPHGGKVEGRVAATKTESGEVDLSQPRILAESQLPNSIKAQTRPSINLQNLQQAEILERPLKLANAVSGLSEQIQTMMKGDMRHVVIRLDPPELGSMEVRVNVQQEQTQVQIVTPSTQVREALEQHSARLREALAEQGLNLSNLDVSDQQTQSESSENEEQRGEAGDSVDAEATLNEEKTAIGLVDQYV